MSPWYVEVQNNGTFHKWCLMKWCLFDETVDNKHGRHAGTQKTVFIQHLVWTDFDPYVEQDVRYMLQRRREEWRLGIADKVRRFKQLEGLIIPWSNHICPNTLAQHKHIFLKLLRFHNLVKVPHTCRFLPPW